MGRNKNIMKECWQDAHIEEDDNGKFICYDEAGRGWIIADTLEEAREQLEIYDKYILNNITD